MWPRTRCGRSSERFWRSGLSRLKPWISCGGRVRERYLGQHIAWDFNDDGGSEELSRVAILTVLDGRWYAGMCLVDGEGVAVELLCKRRFECRREAEFELLRAR